MKFLYKKIELLTYYCIHFNIMFIKMNQAAGAAQFYHGPFHGGIGINYNNIRGATGRIGATGVIGSSYTGNSKGQLVKVRNNGTEKIYG